MPEGLWMTASEVYYRIKDGGYKFVRSVNQIGQLLRSAHDARAGMNKRKCEWLGQKNGGSPNKAEWMIDDHDAYFAWLERRCGKPRFSSDSEAGGTVVAGD